MSPELRPPKTETPIVASRIPPWIIASVAALAVALAVGLYFNGQRAARERAMSAYVLVPSLESHSLWEQLVEAFNQTESGAVNPAKLLFTPIGPSGAFFDEKLLIMIAANDSPEVAVIEADRFVVYVDHGALSPISEHYTTLVGRGLEFDPEAIARATVDGQVYGIPHPTRPAYIVVPFRPKNPAAAYTTFPFVVEYLYRAETSETGQ